MKQLPFIPAIVILSLAGMTSMAGGQPIVDLGANVIVYDMSDDGQVIVGTLGFQGPAFRWTPDGGIENIGGSDPYVSGDGSVIAGTLLDNGIDTAAIWTGGTNWQPLDPLPGGAACGDLLSSTWAVNWDGSVIVGLAWQGCADAQAFRWDSTNGMADLGSLGGNSRANGVSSDGRTVVGWDENPSTGAWRGARWVDGVESLLSPGVFVGDAWDTNSDGSVIVGAGAGPMAEQAYRWTEMNGVQPIGVLGGPGWSALAGTLSEDGNLILGFSTLFPSRQGFAWTPEDGMVGLEDYLTALGVEGLASWSLDTPIAVTPDKRFITGWGPGPSGGVHGFLVNLERSIFADGFESGDTSAWEVTEGAR